MREIAEAAELEKEAAEDENIPAGLRQAMKDASKNGASGSAAVDSDSDEDVRPRRRSLGMHLSSEPPSPGVKGKAKAASKAAASAKPKPKPAARTPAKSAQGGKPVSSSKAPASAKKASEAASTTPTSTRPAVAASSGTKGAKKTDMQAYSVQTLDEFMQVPLCLIWAAAQTEGHLALQIFSGRPHNEWRLGCSWLWVCLVPV